MRRLLALLLCAAACSETPPSVAARGTLRGTITVGEPGDDRSGIIVQAIGPDAAVTTTDVDGQFVLALPPGPYQVTATVPSSREGEVRSTAILPPGGEAAVTLAAQAVGDVAGDLTSVPDAIVAIAGDRATGITNASGHYVVRNVPVGTRALFFTASGYQPLTNVPATVHWGKVTTLPPLLLAALTQANASFSGKVHVWGAPDSGGVGVSLFPGNYVATSDADGVFQFTDIPSGLYGLTAMRADRSRYLDRILVADGHAQIVDPAFAPLDTIEMPRADEQPLDVEAIEGAPHHESLLYLRRDPTTGEHWAQLFDPATLLPFETFDHYAKHWFSASGDTLFVQHGTSGTALSRVRLSDGLRTNLAPDGYQPIAPYALGNSDGFLLWQSDGSLALWNGNALPVLDTPNVRTSFGNPVPLPGTTLLDIVGTVGYRSEQRLVDAKTGELRCAFHDVDFGVQTTPEGFLYAAHSNNVFERIAPDCSRTSLPGRPIAGAGTEVWTLTSNLIDAHLVSTSGTDVVLGGYPSLSWDGEWLIVNRTSQIDLRKRTSPNTIVATLDGTFGQSTSRYVVHNLSSGTFFDASVYDAQTRIDRHLGATLAVQILGDRVFAGLGTNNYGATLSELLSDGTMAPLVDRAYWLYASPSGTRLAAIQYEPSGANWLRVGALTPGAGTDSLDQLLPNRWLTDDLLAIAPIKGSGAFVARFE